MIVTKTFITLEKLYEKRLVLDKQIKELEKKVLLDLEKIIIMEKKSTSKALPKKPVTKKTKPKKKTTKK